VVVVLVVAVVDTLEAESAAAEWSRLRQTGIQWSARLLTIAEACVLLMRAPGSSVPRFINRRPLRERIAGWAIQWRINPEHPGGTRSIEE
jgi:hypothetical protein